MATFEEYLSDNTTDVIANWFLDDAQTQMPSRMGNKQRRYLAELTNIRCVAC